MSCDLCSRLREVTPIPYPHIMYCKAEDVKLIIIARNPGLENDYTHINEDIFMESYKKDWWTCRVGKYIRERLGDHLIKNHTLFTNIIKCSSPKNSPPTMPEKQRCLPYLQRQIDLLQPKTIITMSSDAKQMLGKQTIPVFNLYHPSYFIYNPSKSSHQDKLLLEIRKRLE